MTALFEFLNYVQTEWHQYNDINILFQNGDKRKIKFKLKDVQTMWHQWRNEWWKNTIVKTTILKPCLHVEKHNVTC